MNFLRASFSQTQDKKGALYIHRVYSVLIEKKNSFSCVEKTEDTFGL